nr:immunoglobulin light chain junction region [Macaca mulatta]MOV35569.1 immunoglobulin light chain junction region [Macaca mulatta]
CQQYNILPRTF